MSVQSAHLGGAVIVCGFGTLIVVALAWAAYTSAQRCLVSGRCQHCTVGKRSLALALPSQLFAAFAMLLALGYEAQRAGLLGANAAASPAACRAIFVASHLTPSLYAAPYVLRGLRMATLFDTNLRRKYRWLVQDRCVSRVSSHAARRCKHRSLAPLTPPPACCGRSLALSTCFPSLSAAQSWQSRPVDCR